MNYPLPTVGLTNDPNRMFVEMICADCGGENFTVADVATAQPVKIVRRCNCPGKATSYDRETVVTLFHEYLAYEVS